MSEQENNLQDIITQLVNLSVYVLKTQAINDPAHAQLTLGAAIEHSKKNDRIDPKLLVEMFEHIFPGQPIPKVVPSNEFAEIVRRQQSGNS